MIELNLLKERLDRFQRQRLTLHLFFAYMGGLLLLLLFLSLHFISNRIEIRRIRSEIKAIEQKIAGEKERVAYIQAREKESARLLKEITFFQQEAERRVLWAPILYFTGKSTPAGLWLELFSVKGDGASRDTQTKKGTVVLAGYVLPEVRNERETIDLFVRNISAGNTFSTVSLKEVKKEVRNEEKVVSFVIECALR